MADDRRKKDVNWALNVDAFGTVATDNAHLAVLMDIRDELKRLNRTLECPNFLRIPYWLEKIEINTRKPKRRKAK